MKNRLNYQKVCITVLLFCNNHDILKCDLFILAELNNGEILNNLSLPNDNKIMKNSSKENKVDDINTLQVITKKR